MDKVIRGDKVAVLYSPGDGAGWFTWNSSHPECLYDPEIVAAVEAGDHRKAAELSESKWPNFYSGGAKDLEIIWLTQGDQFEVEEYDGSESIHVVGQRNYLTA